MRVDACNQEIGRLAIQVRDQNQLEHLQQVDTVFFDKTGVLTARKIKVGSYFLVDREKDAMLADVGNEDVVSLIKDRLRVMQRRSLICKN